MSAKPESLQTFVRVRGGSEFSKSGPAASVRKNGAISLNEAAVGLLPEGTKHVELLFSPSDNTVIGLRPVAERTQNSYIIGKQGAQYLINAETFLRRRDMKPAIRHPYPVTEAQGVLIIDMSEPSDNYEEYDPSPIKTKSARGRKKD